ncbi:hypothetical protein CEXT_475351 [Caerostris extrusa]|uniref:Uncharacterized protein n=1 Tax=Caerostris extrusa TaxID=172846 RepID=A0AAV4TFM9_CAEEX|nr:hypothetical protein CEXT_475351 [Caerostris extrusa]
MLQLIFILNFWTATSWENGAKGWREWGNPGRRLLSATSLTLQRDIRERKSLAVDGIAKLSLHFEKRREFMSARALKFQPPSIRPAPK